MNKEQLIEIYMNDEEFLFNTWYSKNISKRLGIEDGEFTGAMLPLKDLKDKFKDWCTDNYKILKKTVCMDFNYERNKEKIQDTVSLIMLLSRHLEIEFDFPLELATIIILMGVDKLCSNVMNSN